jgi:hypothetical protein
MSTCFNEPIFDCKEGNDPWGWSINYCADDGAVTCQLYVGATACDVSVGQLAGSAEITTSTFTINVDSDKFPDNMYTFEYNFYAGECIGSDGGAIVQSGICDADLVGTYASAPDSYPFTSTSTPIGEYTFTTSNRPREGYGSSYSVFPIGSHDRKYVSGHVKICSAGAR